MKTKTYTCAWCGETYKEGWTDEDAEVRENFGEIKKEECRVVCDDCYNQMFPHFPEIKKSLS